MGFSLGLALAACDRDAGTGVANAYRPAAALELVAISRYCADEVRRECRP